MMILICIPTMIINHGYFIYSGDYNYQTINFTVHVYNMIRSGYIKSDLFTALGTDFFMSYSHIIFTPFFIIELLLPSEQLLILFLPIITSLKFATASLTAFIYIRRYVENSVSAYIGAFLYGFSGFQSFNLIFGSFPDKTALFPLMLVFIDDFFEKDKKGRFAVIVAIMASMSAFFFYGQVVFLIIYFFVKCIYKQYKITMRSFICIFLEAIIGIMISAVLLLPSALELSTNSRVSSFINGIECLSYPDRSIIWRILQSIFMMPDRANYTSLFSGENTWASISLYLPCVGCVFVVSYIKNNKKTWESTILIISFIMMLIPVLNSIFFMFNSEYYGRWFYMPILIMALVTSKEIEVLDFKRWMVGFKVSIFFIILFSLIACLPGESVNVVDEKIIKTVSLFSFPPDSLYFWKYIGISGLLLIVIYFIISKNYKKIEFLKRMLCTICACIVVLNVIYIHDVDGIDELESEKYEKWTLHNPNLPDDSFYRVDGNQINSNLNWNIGSINNFITDYAQSLVDFYKAFNIIASQKASIDQRYYPINALLSCKYYFSRSSCDELNVELIPLKLEGFEKKYIQSYYHIYENKAYIPLGFSYNYYITESKINEFTTCYGKEHPELREDEKNNEVDGKNALSLILEKWNKPVEYDFSEKYLKKMLVMLRAIVIPDEDESKVNGILSPLPDTMLEGLGTETYYADCADRKAESCSEFNVTKTGFEAKISSDKQNLVYFSVPIMDGWSAEVNGKEAEILKVNYGFMAVKVDEGDNEIVFNYENKNFRTGAVISIIGLVMFIIYMIVCRFTDRNRSKREVKVSESTVQEGN